MTLTQGRFISYEYDRMVVLFSMLDGEKEIHCAIPTSAMDDLEGAARARAGQREAQFMRLRSALKPAPTANIRRPSSRARRPALSCAASISESYDRTRGSPRHMGKCCCRG